MKYTHFSTPVRAGVLALSLLLLPITTPTFAQMQETRPAPEAMHPDPADDRGNMGLWGLVGLLGLAGLAGRRRTVPDRTYTEASPRR
jgi:MYXO-CTERM domain-containing protein